jgi:hypothetical protein
MSHRPNESFVPEHPWPWYTVGGKISDKNLLQRINIKFCVKIDKSASETLAVLTVAHGDYTMKK